MNTEQKINLTAEQRAELDRKETRNKTIVIAIGIVASVATMLFERKLDKKLIEEYAPEDVILEEG